MRCRTRGGAIGKSRTGARARRVPGTLRVVDVMSILTGRPSHTIQTSIGAMMVMASMMRQVIAFLAIAADDVHAMLLIVAMMMII